MLNAPAQTDILPRANWNLIPEHIRDGVALWISDGIAPGGFLSAVIRNDLKDAFGRADHINRERIHDIVSFFYSHAPSPCWGSPEAFDRWEQAGGLNGRRAKASR
jgi:hypothetical protein